MKRLIRKGTDIHNRKCAITYINGEILESGTHSDAIGKYLQQNYGYSEDETSTDGYRPDMSLLFMDFNELESYALEYEENGYVVDPNSTSSDDDDDDDDYDFLYDDFSGALMHTMYLMRKNLKSFALAHSMGDGVVRLMTETVYGCSESDVVNALSQHYDNCKVYDDISDRQLN